MQDKSNIYNCCYSKKDAATKRIPQNISVIKRPRVIRPKRIRDKTSHVNIHSLFLNVPLLILYTPWHAHQMAHGEVELTAPILWPIGQQVPQHLSAGPLGSRTYAICRLQGSQNLSTDPLGSQIHGTYPQWVVRSTAPIPIGQSDPRQQVVGSMNQSARQGPQHHSPAASSMPCIWPLQSHTNKDP